MIFFERINTYVGLQWPVDKTKYREMYTFTKYFQYKLDKILRNIFTKYSTWVYNNEPNYATSEWLDDICFISVGIKQNKLYRGVMGKVLDDRIVVTEFELLSPYFVHFSTNTLGNIMNPLIQNASRYWLT